MVTKQDIVFQDRHYIVINKRGGDAVQLDKTGDIPLEQMTRDFLRKEDDGADEPFLGLAHRLDRPVSGLVLFAKTSEGLQQINQLFKSREMRKVYWAVVRKEPEHREGKLVHWLVKDAKANKAKAYKTEVKGSQRAELNYKVLAELMGYYLIEISLLTGRFHQIRAQLSAMGCPIIGDNKYGYPRGSSKRSICLHAGKLEFLHPLDGEWISINAPLPKDGFWERFEHLIEH